MFLVLVRVGNATACTNQAKSVVPFPFLLASEIKTTEEGLGLASVQDERRVPLIPVQSSPVPHFPKARLEQQQFVFCSL